MPPPKPKPRAQLAKAALAASEWHFSTKPMSDKQREAARKNYEYVHRQLVKTGGALTAAERKIGEAHRDERRTLRPPPPRLGDVRDRAEGAQRRNLARGAAKTGGMGQTERTRLVKAFTAPGGEKKRGEAILKELRRQGFSPPRDEKQAQAQVKQALKAFEHSERTALREARKHPLRVGWNAPLIGRESAEQMALINARNMAARANRPPPPGVVPTWAGKVGAALDYITPERAERPAQIVGGQVSKAGWAITPDALKPFLKPAVADVKNLTAGAAMAIPTIAETVYNDFAGNTKWGAAKLVKEMGVGWAQGIESAIPGALPADRDLPAVWEDDYLKKLKWAFRGEGKRAATEWKERPVTSLLNVYPLASGAARLATFPELVSSIAKANPSMSKAAVVRAARKESYRPGYGALKLARTSGKEGWKGGIPPRLLQTKIVDPDTGKVLREGEKVAARPLSRSALGREFQGAYDRWSRGETWFPAPGKIPGTKRFGELHRASRAIQRRDALNLDVQATKLNQMIKPVEAYIRQSGIGTKTKNVLLNRLDENRARLAETFYGAQGPTHADALDTLRAVSEDLKSIAREGGQEIPTNKLGKIDKQLRRIDRRLERFGTPVDWGEGAWAQATNLMREAGYSQPLIEGYQALMNHRAQVWARREPGRDPNDWLESPDGRNIAGFEHGAPSPEALSTSLFQEMFPGERPPWIPEVVYPKQKMAARAKSKLRPRKGTATGVPETPELWATAANGERFKIAGDITPEDWVQRVQAVVPDPKARDDLARWYEHYEPMFRKAFGEDADAIMRAFAVSQANASPSSGLGAVLKVMDKLRRGEEIGPREISVVGQAIGLAAKGEVITKSVAAKLSDFINSLEGRSTRTWMDNVEEAGSPVAVDVHAIRDRGFIDKKLKRRVEALGAVEGRDFKIEGRGAATGPLYERIAEWYHEVTDHLNEIEFDGRFDWTPAQAQALGWSTIQIAHGVLPEGFAEAFARNSRGIEFEVTRGAGNLGADLSLEQSRAVAQAMLAEAEELAESIPGIYVRGVEVGQGGWNQGNNANIRVTVIGSRDAIEESLEKFARAFDQEWVQASREVSSKAARAAVVISSPAFADSAATARFFTALNRIEPKLEGYMLFDVEGVPGIAIQTSNRIVTPKTADRFLNKYAEAIKQAEAEAEVSVGYTARNIELLTGGQHGATAPIHTLPGAGGGRAAVDDPLASRIRAKLESEIDRARGGPEPEAGLPEEVPAEASALAQQSTEGAIRGAVHFLDSTPGRQTIYLSEHADPSTFAHELFGHAAYEMKGEYPEQFAAVEKRYGKELEDWTEVEHERFAREFERYLMKGKAPVAELQPVFDRMRVWMRSVYETIKALGRPINPETQRLFDRYFGKEPLDFTPPQRIRRSGKNALPDPADDAGVGKLVDDTAALLLRGADVLRNDPKAVQQIAGSMKWLEQQVLPYLDQRDPALAARVHDLFGEFDEVKSGASIFDADQRRLLIQRGKLMGERHAQLKKMADALNAQPDAKLLEDAVQVMDDLDEAESLEDVAELIPDLKAVGGEIGARTRGDYERQRLLERQVADLERAIDLEGKRVGKGKKAGQTKAQRDEAIGILKEMSAQMTDMFIDVFGEGLGPEALEMLKRTLAVRDDLIPTRLRELGLLDEGTGHGSYIPHYSIYDRLYFTLRGPVRLPAAGRNRKVLSTEVRKGAETFGKGQNKLIRYGTGELQVDPRALFSAYRNRLRFLETAHLRNRLFEMGAKIPIDPDTGRPRIPEGWYIINGSGDTVPQELKDFANKSQREIDEMLASEQDINSLLFTEKGTVKLLEEYRDKWLSKKGKAAAAYDRWKTDDLRILPPEVVDTMVGKVFESTPGGSGWAAAGLLGTAGRVATIFSHPMGYISANVAANSMLLALTNPARMPRAISEFLKGPTSLRAKNPRLYEDISTQTGDVMAEAGIPSFYVKEQTGMERTERAFAGTSKRWATFLGDMGDQPFRVASWTGHARKYGYRNPEQWRELLDSTDPEVVRIRDDIGQRAREDMLDFNKLTPQEQRMARVLFIWPFIRASVAQPLWMMREYPGRFAAMTQVAAAQERAYEGTGVESVKGRYDKIAPAEERSMFDIGEVPVAGGSINMGVVNPVGPFAEKFVGAAGMLQNPKDLRALGELVNPAYSSIAEGVFGREGMDYANAAKSIVPFASYLLAAIDPKHRGAKKYTDRDSFLDYLRRREGRFWPEQVSTEKVKESGKKEADRLDTRKTWEKAEETDLESYEKIATAAEKHGVKIGPKSEAKVKKSITAYHAIDKAESDLAGEMGKDKDDLTETERLEATLAVVKEYFPKTYQTLPPRETWSQWPEKKIRGSDRKTQQTYREWLRDQIQAARSEFFKAGRDAGVEIE